MRKKYTLILDDSALARVNFLEVSSLREARTIVREHIELHPAHGTVTADIGEPGDETPRWFLVSTPRGIRTYTRPQIATATDLDALVPASV